MFSIFSRPSDLESLRTKSDVDSPWKGLHPILLTTQMAANLQGLEPWTCISQLKNSPPDIWSCIDTGDLQIKLTLR